VHFNYINMEIRIRHPYSKGIRQATKNINSVYYFHFEFALTLV